MSIWPELKLDPFRRVSGHLVFFHGTGQTAKRYTFYNAALVYYDCRLEARGQHKQAALITTLHFSAATVEVQGQRVAAYSVIPWRTDPATSFRALTKPPDPLPWAGLGVVVRESLLKAEQLAGGLVKKVITPTGELGTELLGVSAEAVARAASLTAGILLTPANDVDAPGYAPEKDFNKNHPIPLPDRDQLRLSELELEHERRSLTPDEEAEMIALLAKVKGIHVQKFSDLVAKVPFGFPNSEEFVQAGEDLKAALKESSLAYKSIGVRGSSVTGLSSKGGSFRTKAQNGLNPSDVDVFIELSDDIDLTDSKSIPGFIHPDKIAKRYPALKQWSKKWTQKLGREISPGVFKPRTFTDKDVIFFK
ncbi:hypothetical protein [Hymenobacter terrenus]|uniref:hypothetical protein n=1 Tax=Hymenobacter terrenus TaxID=1629124 RepID=UPI00061995D6|nr:hypothetical protein [Hymenobacter terrenus]